MSRSPESALTPLCSGIQLYSAERRIADCILADVKWAATATSAELARESGASEATVTRLCHKLGFENFRKFQLALARDVMEQQEAEKLHSPVLSRKKTQLDTTLQRILLNKQEEVRATMQALEPAKLNAAVECLLRAKVVEVASSGHNLTVALDASVKFSELGKRCVASAIHEKNHAFAKTLTSQDALIVISGTGRSDQLEEVAAAAKAKGAPIILITGDRHSPLAQMADHVLVASNREQRLIEIDHAPSQLSGVLIVEVLYYLLLSKMGAEEDD